MEKTLKEKVLQLHREGMRDLAIAKKLDVSLLDVWVVIRMPKESKNEKRKRLVRKFEAHIRKLKPK